jgi:large subunit ribosomal protein L21
MKDNYSVVQIGKSQEIVSAGDEILVHKINEKDKAKVTFDKVLLKNVKGKFDIGDPYVKSSKVEAQVIEQTKGEKVRKQTYKAKSRQRRHVGHRQELTKIKILSI